MKSRKLLIVASLCVALPLFGYFFFARPSVAGPDGEKIYWPPVVGETFPNIVLMDQNGEPTSLHDFRGKAMLIQVTSMASPACQSLSGAAQHGVYGNGPVDPAFPSVREYLEQQGVDWDDDRLVYVQILVYDMEGAPPTPEVTRKWADHFHLDRDKQMVVLQGNRLAQRFLPPATVPMLCVLDKKFVLRATINPSNSEELRTALFPVVKPLVDEVRSLPGDHVQRGDANDHETLQQIPTPQLSPIESGDQAFMNADYRAAVKHYRTALAEIKSVTQHHARGRLLERIGDAQQELHLTVEAITSFKHAFSAYKEAHDQGGQCSCLLHLIALYKESDIDTLRRICDEAWNLAEVTCDSELRGRCLRECGFAEARHGYDEIAITNFNNAAELLEETYSLHELCTTLHAAAQSHARLGDWEAAEACLQRAQRIARDLNSASLRAKLTQTLANVQLHLGQLDAALETCERGLQAANESDDPHTVARLSQSMAVANYHRSEYDAAMTQIQHAIKLQHQLGNSRAEAELWASLAMVCKGVKQTSTALSCLAKATQIAQRDAYPVVRAQCLVEVARLKAESQQPHSVDQAIRLATEAIMVLEGTLRNPADTATPTLLGNVEDAYGVVIDLLINQGRDAEALHFAERSRARAFIASLGDFRPPVRGASRKLTWEVHQLEQSLLRENVTSNDRDDVNETRRRYEAALTRVWPDAPTSVAARKVNVPSIEGMQRAIGARALVEYYFGGEKSWMWFVTSENIDVVELPVTRSELRKLVKHSRDEIIGDRSTGEFVATEQLSRTLIPESVDALLETVSRLVVAPHDAAYYVPFQALTRHNGGECIIDTHVIETVMSAGAWMFHRHQGRDSDASMFATLSGATMPWLQPSDEIAPGSSLHILSKAAVLPLRSTDAESAAVNKLMETLDRLAGEAFTRESLTQAVENVGVAHITTRGFFKPRSPLRSGFFTSDGIVTLRDVFGWKTDADLIVTPSFGARIGGLADGSDIVMAARAFQYAGCRSLVTTHWRKPDSARATWMNTFYSAAMTGNDHAEAARLATLDLRQSHPHPRDWAGFVLIGEGR